MFKLFNKPKFPVKLFTAASITALILFIAMILLLRVFTAGVSAPKQNAIAGKAAQAPQDGIDDPFITKVPALKDMIKGPIITDVDPAIGEAKAPVTIVVYSDYECDFCGKQEKILREAMDKFAGKIKLIRKDYPEEDENSISFRAAEAGRCAHEQNKFWSYHDLLFKNSGNLSEKIFADFAAKLNLNLSEFTDCLAKRETAQLIKNGCKEANALEITGIPFIYVNNQEIMGQITLGELEEMIKNELK